MSLFRKNNLKKLKIYESVRRTYESIGKSAQLTI